jgi:hypothetical protein
MTETSTVRDLKAISEALDLAYYENQRIPEAQAALATLAEVWTKIAAMPEFDRYDAYLLGCHFCDYHGQHEPDCLFVRARKATEQT